MKNWNGQEESSRNHCSGLDQPDVWAVTLDSKNPAYLSSSSSIELKKKWIGVLYINIAIPVHEFIYKVFEAIDYRMPSNTFSIGPSFVYRASIQNSVGEF